MVVLEFGRERQHVRYEVLERVLAARRLRGGMSALILQLLFNVSKGAERTTWTVASGDHVVTLGRLVNLRMKLLLGPRVTVLALVAILADGRLEPVVALLDVGARRGAVFEDARVATLVTRIVVLRTGESLATETWRSFARLRLVVDEHVVGVVPFGIFVELTLLLEIARQVERLLVHVDLAKAATTTN